MRRTTTVAIILAVFGWASRASAGEFQLEAGPSLAASSWRGDYGGGGGLRFGYRFAGVVALDFAGWERYATVNHRLDTGLTLGVTGFLPLPALRPSLRLYAIHQHEEALVSVQDHPVGTVFGIGAGIRHRAGAGVDLGVEIPIRQTSWGDYHIVAGGSATWFPDATLGPSVDYGINAGIGLNYSVPGLP